MISIRNLIVRYAGAERPAVDDVSFDVVPGRITAVVGPNGSGKSTIVRALLGRQPIASGEIRLGDAPLDSFDRMEIARQLAVVPQREEPVFPIPVRDYIGLGRFPHGGPFAARDRADRDAIANAVARADVASLTDRPTDALSGGEWQRVRIARSMSRTRWPCSSCSTRSRARGRR
jgi:iron complex transport system ATP-binding protein